MTREGYQFATLLVMCLTVIRALTKNGTLRTIRIGRRIIVSVQSLREFVDGTTETTDKTHVGK